MNEVKLKVLLIEDDPDYALITRTYLQQADSSQLRFQIDHADQLETGIKRLKENQYDALLLDLMLPDSDGIATVLLVMAEARELPIVVMSSLTDESLAIEAVSLGAQDYLVKGNANAELLKRSIRYAIERKKLISQLERMIISAAEGMVVIDTDGIVQYLNPVGESIFGVSKEEMLGKPFPYPYGRQPQMISVKSQDGLEKPVELRVTELDWRQQPAYLASLRPGGARTC